MARWLVLLPLLGLLTVLLPAGGETEASPGGVTERVSVDSQGGEADDASFEAAISGDGRYVAFASVATNLVPGDANGLTDVFRRDVITGETLRVSENSQAGGGDAASRSPDISDDGQLIVFQSSASNLLASAGVLSIFGRFMGAEGVEPAPFSFSVDSEEDLSTPDHTCPIVAARSDGPVIAYAGEADPEFGIDAGIQAGNVETGENWFLKDARPDSCGMGFSADGSKIAWVQDGVLRVWVLDTGEVTDILCPTCGQEGRANVAGVEPDGDSSDPSISGDGRYVAFRSFATNLVPGDTNDRSDIFVHDLETGETTRVSVNSEGVQGNATSRDPSISGGGRFVSFSSSASNLVPGDTNGFNDIFVHDRQTGETVRVSVSSDGGESDAHTFESAISANGRVVAFFTAATNLVPGDTNGVTDVFIHGILPEGVEATWGDNNCSGSAGPVDSLLTLRFDAGLDTNTGDCPEFGQVVEVQFASPHPWGDVDCSGAVTPVDSLKLLRFDAGLGASQAEGCPGIGTSVTIFDG